MTKNIARARVLGLYVDASVGKRLASSAVVKRLGMFKRVVRKDSIGWASLLAKIAQNTTSLYRAGMDLRFRWSLGYSGIIGNKEADEATRIESNREGKPTAPILERVREVLGIVRLINEDRCKDLTALDTTSMPGRYT